MKRETKRALTLTAIYLVVGLAWIYFSDAALDVLVDDRAAMRQLQTWKGTGFIIVTGLALFLLSWYGLKRQASLIAGLERFAYYNSLTGLPNRRRMERLIADALERADVSKKHVGVATLDLDNFGSINDSFGHSVGNELLIAVADRLVEALPANAILGHPSADEFVIVTEGLENHRQLTECIHQVRDSLIAPFQLSGIRDVYVSACIGASCYPDDGGTENDLIQFADAALGMAKRSGPGSFALFAADMVLRPRRRVDLDGRLRDALQRDELELYYQPIVSSADVSEIIGVEALLRWNPPGEAPIPPAEFIPVAEDTGLILTIGDWAVEKACAQLAEWDRQGLPRVTASVNISARQFESGELTRVVADALAHNGLTASRLTLEITESLLMEQGQAALTLLGALRRLGVGLALDDFGTGYSSLSYLHHLPVDSLKIDRSFIINLEQQQTERDLVAAIIGLGHTFRLPVIAEGVENQAQEDILRSLGCDRYQGYRFGKPLPADETGVLLAGSRSQSVQ